MKKLMNLVLSIVVAMGMMPLSSVTAYANSYVAYVGNQGYETIEDARRAWDDGTVLKLNEDIGISTSLVVDSGSKTLDLNGHGLKYTGSDNDNGRVIKINTSGTLTLIDSDQNAEHKYTISSPTSTVAPNGAGLATVDDNAKGEEGIDYFKFTGGYITGGVCNGIYSVGTFNMQAGTIIGNKTGATTYGGGVVAYGKFNMSGGLIAGNYGSGGGGGIKLGNNSEFTMSAGKIIQNYSGSSGGGILMDYSAKAEMTDGEIGSNYVDASTNGGGGVFLGSSSNDHVCSFTMTGGKIMDNASSYDGGGVYIERNGSFIMDGGSIQSNRCVRNGGGINEFSDAKMLNISGGSITGNYADKNGGAIYTSGFTSSGNPVIKDNKRKSGDYYIDGNLNLNEGYKIKIEKAFTTGAEIHLTQTKYQSYYQEVFTSGFSDKNPDMDPNKIFFDDNPENTYSIGLKNGEAAFVLKVKLTEDQKPTAVEGMKYTGSPVNLVNEPKSELPESCSMNYVLGKDTESVPTSGWSAAIPTATEAGTYYVWYKAIKTDGTESDAGVLKVVIEKSEETIPELSDKQKPAVLDGLKYDGSEQELVSAPTAELPEGYSMRYAIGENGTDLPKDGWSDSIPKKKETGTYYVWFKAVKGSLETKAECLEVTIHKSEDESEGGYEKLMPVLEEVTGSSIRVKKVDGYEFSIRGNNWSSEWTEDGEFDGLDADAEYVILLRKSGDTEVIGMLHVKTNKEGCTTEIEKGNVQDLGKGFIRTESRVEGGKAEVDLDSLSPELALKLANSIDETAEERIKNGETLLMYLEVKTLSETDVADDEKDTIDEAAKNEDPDSQFGGFLDMSLFIKIGNDEPQQISNAGEKLKTIVNVPENLKAPEGEIRLFFIVRLHGDEAEVIASGEGDQITVDSELYSTYAIYYKTEAEPEPTPTPDPTPEPTPDPTPEPTPDPTPDPEQGKTQSDNARTLVVRNKSNISNLFSKYGASGYKYKFKLENKAEKKIASVSNKGKIKVKNPGNITVSLFRKIKGGSWSKIEEQKFTLEKPELPKKVTNLKVGDAVYAQSYITNTMINQPTRYESSKPAVASVDSYTGRIIVHSSGTTKIKIIYGSGKGAAVYKVKFKVQ